MRILFLLFFCTFAGADPRVNEKILGGRDCKEDEAQYYVAICKGQCNTRRDIICGGTLIRPDWVLTATRCYTDKTLKVISDAHNLQKPVMTYEVEKHIPHPNPHETGADFYFDILLLKLKKPINRNIQEPTKKECKSMNPLLTATHNPTPPTFFVAGHGMCGYDLSHLNPVKCPLCENKLQCFNITWTQCPANWNDNPKYSKNIFCAGGGGKTTRPGDSGGGLVINSTVYGIVHRGNNIDTAGNTPGIYINVCAFRDWIMKTAV